MYIFFFYAFNFFHFISPLTSFEVQVQDFESDDTTLLSLEDVQALEAARILEGIVVGRHDLLLGRRNQLAAAVLGFGLPRCPEKKVT